MLAVPWDEEGPSPRPGRKGGNVGAVTEDVPLQGGNELLERLPVHKVERVARSPGLVLVQHETCVVGLGNVRRWDDARGVPGSPLKGPLMSGKPPQLEELLDGDRVHVFFYLKGQISLPSGETIRSIQ